MSPRFVAVGGIFCAAFITVVLANVAAAKQSTVRDLVDCLGNKTRYSISQDGPEILVQSTPWNFSTFTDDDDDDDAVYDCLDKLDMHSGSSYQVVPLDELHPGQTDDARNLVTVPLDFVPESRCKNQPLAESLANHTVPASTEIHPDNMEPDGTLIGYRADAFYARNCPSMRVADNFYWPGDTDCIETDEGKPAWKSVRIKNISQCAKLYAKSYVHHRCSLFGTGQSAYPRRLTLRAGQEGCLARRAHSFCAVSKRSMPCVKHRLPTMEHCADTFPPRPPSP